MNKKIESAEASNKDLLEALSKEQEMHNDSKES